MNKNIKRIEDLLTNSRTFDSVANITAFYLLCEKVDSILKQGEDYTVEHYHRYASPYAFKRHKDDNVPRSAQRLQFYGRKYYVYYE